jgi:N-acyl-D-aspartate/D-glutamate deacylase
MESVADLVIRGGAIYDGTGAEPYVADVVIKDGKIVDIGTFSGQARETIDAAGKMVTPGFIDVHTHYDGQLIWAERMSPSSGHGVTTVVTGNCGVGFAPCRPQDHTRLIKLLEGVEDMPEVVLADGLTWDWESFPEFVEALKRRPHDIDYAVQLPHAALRMFVMGERAVDKAEATEADLAEMKRLAKEAINAGALGLGTSRNIFHTNLDGTVIPTAHTPEAEYKAIAEGMNEAGGGVIQAILNVQHPKPDLEMFRRISQQTGTPLSFSMFQVGGPDKDNWMELLEMTEEANKAGPRTTAQVFARPVGILLGLDASYHPFAAHPSYVKIAHLPLAERVAEMRKPQVRAEILADRPDERGMVFFAAARNYEKIYALGNPPNYEPDPSTSVANLARAKQGSTPEEIVYDMLLEDEGRALLIQTAANYEDHTLDAVRVMLTHPNTVPALGDGGAHYGMICDSTYTTFMLSYWARDRESAPIAMPEVIRAMTAKPAAMLGITDRGVIKRGKKADLNVIDLDRLTLHAPRMVHDLPSGGKRLTQDADGYLATIVSGEVIMRNGQPTGALPGKIVERANPPIERMAAE